MPSETSTVKAFELVPFRLFDIRCTFCLFCEVVHCDKQLLLVPFRWFVIKLWLFFFLSDCSSLICTFYCSFQVVHHQHCTLSCSFQVCSLTCACLSGYSLSTCDLCLRLSILQLLGCELLRLLDFLLQISSFPSTPTFWELDITHMGRWLSHA